MDCQTYTLCTSSQILCGPLEYCDVDEGQAQDETRGHHKHIDGLIAILGLNKYHHVPYQI